MDSSQFGDQISLLAAWFSNWNLCEQTIALYSLLTRITSTQARFLTLVIQHTFEDSIEIQCLEREANSTG